MITAALLSRCRICFYKQQQIIGVANGIPLRAQGIDNIGQGCGNIGGSDVKEHESAIVHAAHDCFQHHFFADGLVALPVGIRETPKRGVKAGILSDNQILLIEFAAGRPVKLHFGAVFFLEGLLQIHNIFLHISQGYFSGVLVFGGMVAHAMAFSQHAPDQSVFSIGVVTTDEKNSVHMLIAQHVEDG